MGFASGLKRMMGVGGGDSAPAGVPRYVAPDLRESSRAPVADAPAPKSAIRVQRDEILGERGRLCGYRFAAIVNESGKMTPWNATDLGPLLADASLQRIAQCRVVVIPALPSVLAPEKLTEFVNPNIVFVTDSSRIAAADMDAFRESMAQLRAAGIKTGLEGAADDEAMAALGGCVDWCIVDLQAGSLLSAEQFGRSRGASGAALGVRGVESWAERDALRECGYGHFLGPFLTAEVPADEGNAIDPGRLRVMDILNKLRTQVEMSEIAASLKLDPGLIVRLLGYVNSPGAGLVQKVTSIEQAIMVLGRDRLYRWCTALLFSSGKAGQADQALLEKALARGRFMEFAGEGLLAKPQCDELFLAGVLTFLEPLLGISMARIVDKLVLTEDVKRMLLRSEGPYGVYLMLALAIEKGRAIESLAERVGVAADDLNKRHTAAAAWAIEALQGS